MPKLEWLDENCHRCGSQLNSWDVRCSKALGCIQYHICEECLCKEYDKTKEEFRDTLEDYFGIRPCKGI